MYMSTNVDSSNQNIKLSYSFVSFNVYCMLWNSHCLKTKCSSFVMYKPRFQFGHVNLV